MPKEQYMCQLCANHGIFNQPKKGHKQKCPHRTCSCELCALNTKRRALDQIERQLKNAGNPGRRNPTSPTVSPDAIVASASSTVAPPTSLSGASTFPFSFTLADYHKEISNISNDLFPKTTSGGGSGNALSLPSVQAVSMEVPFCVALPATIDRKQLKRKRLDMPQDLSIKKSRSLATALQSIARQRSIFHSAEQLAG